MLEINKLNFPDKEFREYIKENFDKDQDGILSNDEINHINIITISNKDIYDLRGIEHFPNLETLYCINTKISSLDISNNEKLKLLHCDNTSIVNLDVSKNTELKTLGCSDTGIQNLDLSNNIHLEFLDCMNTPIKSLDIRNNVNLYDLNYDEDIDIIAKEVCMKDISTYTQAYIDVAKYLFNIGGAEATEDWAAGYDEAVDFLCDEIDKLAYENPKIIYKHFHDIVSDYEGDEEVGDNFIMKKEDLNYKEGMKDLLSFIKEQDINLEEEPDEFKEGYWIVFNEIKEILVDISEPSIQDKIKEAKEVLENKISNAKEIKMKEQER